MVQLELACMFVTEALFFMGLAGCAIVVALSWVHILRDVIASDHGSTFSGNPAPLPNFHGVGPAPHIQALCNDLSLASPSTQPLRDPRS